MAQLHIEEFCSDATRILLQLYQMFPRPGTVFVEDISGPDTPDEFGVHSKRHLACLGTMIWLSEEGYLRFGDTIRQEAIDEAVLTRKGFLMLSASAPAASDLLPEQTQAERLAGLLREASSSELASQLRALLMR